MSLFFFYGTLRHRPLLELVAGAAVDTVPASLPGHAVIHAGQEPFPILVPRDGAVAPGCLVSLSAEQQARVAFYEGPDDYALREMQVETEDGTVTAHIYWPNADRWPAAADRGADWDLEAWRATSAPITMHAVTEVMAAYGLQSAAEVDARYKIIMARAQAAQNTSAWVRPRTIGTAMGRDAVELLDRHYEHLGFFTLEHLHMRHARFDGGPAMEIERTVFSAGEAVTLLPYDPVRDRVLLLEQFRTAPYAKGDPEPWLLEPIAGIVDAGDTIENNARREAIEEAGLSVDTLHFVSRYYPSPGATAQVFYSYVATADLTDELATYGGLVDEGEDIAVHLVPFKDAMAMMESGEIAVAPLIISLQWLATHRASLRAGHS